MGLKFKNNAATTLAALVASTDLSLTVNSTLGAVFPVLGGGDYFYCTLQSLTTPSTIEVVKVTAVAGNVFTIVRGQDGTAAQNFSVGDRVELRLVAAVLNDIPKLDETNTFQLAMTLLQSLTAAGLVTAQGALSVGTTLGVAGVSTLSGGVAFSDGSKLNTSNSLGMRNRIHNGNFAINQRLVTGVVNLAAGAYGHDRWKAGAGGCTYSFATSGNDTILTITAGSLLQIIETVNVEGGVYALANRGTAQARIAVNGAATSGAYAVASVAAPLASANATAGQAVTVEFTAGTVDKVQFEPGTIATPFERRPLSLELQLCQRYYQEIGTPGGNDLVFGGYMGGAGTCYHTLVFPVRMRVAPVAANGGTSFTLTGLSTATFAVIGSNSLRLDLANTGGAVFYIFQNAAGTCRLTLTADL